jgi:hypothetical protein
LDVIQPGGALSKKVIEPDLEVIAGRKTARGSLVRLLGNSCDEMKNARVCIDRAAVLAELDLSSEEELNLAVSSDDDN